MLKKHFFDPNFEFTSQVLKNYLTKTNNKDKICIDIPSGNGRNIFLLATNFKHVYGIDILSIYLEEIEKLKLKYKLPNITTILSDAANDELNILQQTDFVCISHLYNKLIFDKIKEQIKIGTKIYIETPSCKGKNYFELPNKNEINNFLTGFKVHYYKENICYSDYLENKRISFIAIIEKDNMESLIIKRKTRKFNDSDHYDLKINGQYFLLPFRFHRITSDKEIIVNEVGDFLILPTGTYERIVKRQIDKKADSDLYGDLIANYFISEEVISPLIDVLATRYRTKKLFLNHFTGLHIFVISLRCEHTCHYCQVSRVTQNRDKYDMSIDYIDKGIEIMFKSPNPYVTMEFQGGEALLAFDNIKYAVEKAERIAKELGKGLTKVICTNLAIVTEEILEYCKEHEILISTSLDGPKFVHDNNRHKPHASSYELTIKGIELARKILGHDRVSALMTTTKLSLDYPIEIVDEYFNLGFQGIFLRNISPYGFALRTEKSKYDTEKFLTFYKKALDRILEYNFQGYNFTEDLARIFLIKMLSPFNVGFVDLQSPAGLINGVIVFNYDGGVYATDESRMLAEQKDFTFKLGTLNDSYNELFFGKKAQEIAEVWANESLAGCSECAFQQYCGADPVHNHATQGDMYGYRPNSDFCQKNMEIIRYLIELMESDVRVKKILQGWAKTAS